MTEKQVQKKLALHAAALACVCGRKTHGPLPCLACRVQGDEIANALEAFDVADIPCFQPVFPLRNIMD